MALAGAGGGGPPHPPPRYPAPVQQCTGATRPTRKKGLHSRYLAAWPTQLAQFQLYR
jgi:hypothetical protein